MARQDFEGAGPGLSRMNEYKPALPEGMGFRGWRVLVWLGIIILLGPVMLVFDVVMNSRMKNK